MKKFRKAAAELSLVAGMVAVAAGAAAWCLEFGLFVAGVELIFLAVAMFVSAEEAE